MMLTAQSLSADDAIQPNERQAQAKTWLWFLSPVWFWRAAMLSHGYSEAAKKAVSKVFRSESDASSIGTADTETLPHLPPGWLPSGPVCCFPSTNLFSYEVVWKFIFLKPPLHNDSHLPRATSYLKNRKQNWELFLCSLVWHVVQEAKAGMWDVDPI